MSRVRVSGAPGYLDFEAECRGYLRRIDDVTVGYVVMDDGVADLIEEQYITDIPSEVP